MLRKLASFRVLSAHKVPMNASARALKKAAHRVDFEYTPRPGFLYVRSRMISSRCNDNFDEFPAEEIKKAYSTFIGKPVFVNHHNDDHKRARGVVIDAALHEDRNPDGTPDTWVEGLMEVDARKFPKLAKAILAGHIDRTSMGCDVDLSVCSACGNKATNPAQYCQHIPAMKGLRVFRVNAATGRREGHLIREKCYGLKFFENSLLVEEPADPTAFFTGVDDRGLKMAARKKAASHPQYGGTHCLLCGDPVKFNSNPAKKNAPGGGWYHHDSMRRDHPALPADADAVYADMPRQDAQRDQDAAYVNQHLEDLGIPRRKDKDLPPDPFLARKRAARKQAVEDEEIWKGLNLPKAEDTHREVVHDKAKDLADKLMGPLYDEHGGRENFLLNRDNKNMTDLQHRYEGGPGKFAFDEEGSGEPYYEIKHHDAQGRDTGWRARHYADGPNAEIYHAATPGEAHDMLDLGNWTSEGHHLPVHFDHHDLAKALADWHDDEEGGGREYLEQSDPRIRRWRQRRRLGARNPHRHDWQKPTGGAVTDLSNNFDLMKHLADAHGWGHDDFQNAGGNFRAAHERSHAERGDGAFDDEGMHFHSRRKTALPKGMKFHFTPAEEASNGDHLIQATVPGRGGRKQVGYMQWSPRDGVINMVNTEPQYERQGIASHLWDRAHEVAAEHGLTPPRHSDVRTPSGNSWSQRVDENPRTDVAGQQPLIKRPRGNATEMMYAPRPQVDDLREHVIHEHGLDPQFLSDDADFEHLHNERHRLDLDDGYHLHTPQPTEKYALNEVKAPPDVDTLRAEECPVCGDSQVYDGQRCPVCGFVAPPHMFRDPDLQLAQQTDLRQDQAQGDNLLPGQMDPNKPGGGLIDPSQMGEGGSAQDAANQLFHPDQLNPDGVPGYPGDGIPDLMCPACGFQADAEAPETIDTQDQVATGQPTDQNALQPPEEVPPQQATQPGQQQVPGQMPGGPGSPEDPAAMTDPNANPDAATGAASAGDVCPNCGQATLLPIGDAEQMGGAPMGAGGDDLTNPEELPEDGNPQDADVPPGDEADPEAASSDDDTAAPDAGNQDEDEDQADADHDDNTADAVDEEDDPTKDQKDKNPFGKGANRMSKAVEAAVAVHNDVLDGLRKENAVLKAQLTYLARLAGVEPQFAQIRHQADINNPASPVPDPPEEAAPESTEQALAPETMDNPQQPGQTPGSTTQLPAEESTTPLQPGMAYPTSPANMLVDVTAPVAGTNTGEVPLNERRIETDVRIDPDPLKAQGPGVGGQGNNGTAFPWVISSKQEGREVAAMHLAKLRKSAGLAQGDEMAVTSQILGSDMPVELINYEISTLSGVQKAASKRPAGTRRTAARRSAPSLAPEPQALTATAAGGMDDVADADLFM